MMSEMPLNEMVSIGYKFEWMRKLIHLGALAIPCAYIYFDFGITVVMAAILCAIASTIEILRLTCRTVNSVFIGLVGNMLRESEHHSVSAATYMVWSSFITILVFQKPVAILALFYFIAGDGVASLIGKRFGRIFFYGKTLEGSVSCFIVCLLIGGIMSVLPVWIWISGSAIITAAELAPMKINDNIRMPLIGGSFMEILLWIHVQLIHNSVTA